MSHHAKCDCGACDRAKYVVAALDPMWLLFVKAAGWCVLAVVALPFLFVSAVVAHFRRGSVASVKDARGYWNHG